MSEEELTALRNQSVAVMGAAERGDGFTDEESEAAVAVVLAVPALCDEVRFNADAAIAAQRRMEGLEVELARLQKVEREALRVLGAVVYYHASGEARLTEAVLNDDYVVERHREAGGVVVRFKAWPTERHER